jgi:hypothetical protein
MIYRLGFYPRRFDTLQTQIRKMQFVEQAGRHMGSKSMVAAPLWAERCHRDPEYYSAMQRDNEHNSNSAPKAFGTEFDDHMPALPSSKYTFRVKHCICRQSYKKYI